MSETCSTTKHRTIDTGQFTGTESWTRYLCGVLLTDGVRHVAEEASAWWLIDAICSHQLDRHVSAQPFQVWTLELDPHGPGALLTCEDGNGNFVTDQKIEFTDYPESKRAMWLIDDGENRVLLLPSEY